MEHKKLSVLLVDDNPADAKRFQERLCGLGGVAVRVSHVTTLRAALATCGSLQFDLAILDLDLPDSSGAQTVRRFREVYPSGALVVLTDFSDPEVQRRLAAEKDVQGVLRRDESADVLLAHCLLAAVDGYRAAADHRRLQNLVARNPDAALVVDDEGVVRFVNAAALELFGRSREDFIGELLGFSIPEGEMVEIEIVRPDGRRTAAMHVVHFCWDGRRATLASIRAVSAKVQQVTRGHDGSVSDRLDDDAPATHTVLVVEDDAEVRGVIAMTLETQGYDVLGASSAAAALEVLEQCAGNVDLLLTDVVMPGMSGPDLAAAVAASHPGIPVLYMSGYLDVAPMAGLPHRDAVLTKPFTRRTLMTRVRSALGQGVADNVCADERP